MTREEARELAEELIHAVDYDIYKEIFVYGEADVSAAHLEDIILAHVQHLEKS